MGRNKEGKCTRNWSLLRESHRGQENSSDNSWEQTARTLLARWVVLERPQGMCPPQPHRRRQAPWNGVKDAQPTQTLKQATPTNRRRITQRRTAVTCTFNVNLKQKTTPTKIFKNKATDFRR